jgi:hypothetical protein
VCASCPLSDLRETTSERRLDTTLREVLLKDEGCDLTDRVRAALDEDLPVEPAFTPVDPAFTSGENIMEIEARNERPIRRLPWWLAAAACLCLAALFWNRAQQDTALDDQAEGPSGKIVPWGELDGGLKIGLDATRTAWTWGENLVFTVRAMNSPPAATA